MGKQGILKGLSLSKQLSFTAVFSALCCVSTLVFTVPLPASGYFNTGDVFVLLSAWFLGPIFGAVAAGIGSALADVFSGFALYAPATLIIKACMAFISYMVWAFFKKIIKKDAVDFLPRALSAILAEFIMVAGYFTFECVLYGLAGGAANILGNTLQGACCLCLATALCTSLYPIKPLQRTFPFLTISKKHQAHS